ncbi:hypothetical protein BT96DRAFT_952930 [Gymnopus androsaceus JB14]|uniref:Uncharacterized protein n=1 Tax=Gymnopus androsaceus JB14 TaxID=1447944 RepID=A0A6A4IK16_9AGAR|nr:hypothetical protein BT96DRAFT_952930 [Gymnopus androsaceus JB14]
MTTLPSFVELMATLGINAKAEQPKQDGVPSSSTSSSPTLSPKMLNLPVPSLRSKSSPSLRDQASRARTARYSPYSSTFLIVNVFGSSTDLSATTPISTYVRRKTPGTSPSSPSFPRESDDSREFSKPFTIPTLPPFLPRSASSDSFPLIPKSEIDIDNPSSSPLYGLKRLPDMDIDILSRRSRLHTGIRISTPPQFADAGEKAMHHRIVHVA